ncbi:threonine synthase [Geomicrobium halophilum]|uniref:Threonine synthase n=1 Tax=Geomicrobium halophilum TaxID=549000 RepID=A0A841PJ21_9BACL|nr:threonine synthase [Geomicrobium halophilum]MBB6448790.1 threonine synthase [Geomicrobium halophilum]
MAYTYLSHLYCPRCENRYSANELYNLCSCGSPLLVAYHLEKAKKEWHYEQLHKRLPSLWRYHEMLPVTDPENVISFGEGMTPLIDMRAIGDHYDISYLQMKDEGLVPTGSFKARGAAVGVSKAKELGVEAIAMPTNGNAGAAWSLYASRAGIDAHIVMPKSAPPITHKECQIGGARVYIVDGLISDAGRMVAKAAHKYGWFDASTLKEPYRIEGKKTMGYEIAEQLNWQLPDAIVYPTGGGVGLIGIYKSLQELRGLGWIEEDQAFPRLVAVQAENCAPIVKAYDEGNKESEFWPDSETVAFGINVPKALGDFLVLEAIEQTNGCAVAISDDEILKEQERVADLEGAFICPEGAATLSAVQQLREEKWLARDDHVICLNTGLGLKYPETVETPHTVLAPDYEI